MRYLDDAKMFLALVVAAQVGVGHAFHQAAGPAVARHAWAPLGETRGGLLRGPYITGGKQADM